MSLVLRKGSKSQEMRHHLGAGKGKEMRLPGTSRKEHSPIDIFVSSLKSMLDF